MTGQTFTPPPQLGHEQISVMGTLLPPRGHQHMKEWSHYVLKEGDALKAPHWTERAGNYCELLTRNDAPCRYTKIATLRDGHRVCFEHLRRLLSDGWIRSECLPSYLVLPESIVWV